MKRTILIADDEEIILGLLEEFFTTVGFDVILATSGEEALEHIKKNVDISLVFTDVKMGKMSGIDLLKMIREYRRNLPVVIITGYKTLENAVSAVKYGAYDYISKPFNLEDVQKVVNKILKEQEVELYKLNLFAHLVSSQQKYQFKSRDVKPEIIARSLVQQFLDNKLCSPTEYNQLQIALNEVIINALEHGNLELKSEHKGEDFEETAYRELREKRLQDPQYADKLLTIEIKFNEGILEITVEDSGEGFDYSKILEGVENPVLSLDAFGRGFMYLNHLVDAFYFNDKGNRITLIKKLGQDDNQK